jgi:uncharacterized membrane protein
MTMHAVHHHSSDSDDTSASTPEARIRRVPVTAPLAWLSSGWSTLTYAPGPSLLYGLVFAGLCFWITSLIMSNPGFTTAFLTGLLLIGPVLATGLYVAARQHAEGKRVSIRDGLALIWDRRDNLSLFLLFLGIVMAAWVRIAALLFAFQVDAFGPTAYNWRNFLAGGFDPVIVGFFVVIGGILAVAVFVTSAVAIPMIADRDVSPITAMVTSYRAVKQNPLPMALWAALIAALTVLGILSWFIAIVFLFPLLGYASWYSYRHLVE